MSNILPINASDSDILHEIGRRLVALRKGRRLPQGEAAELSGISRRTLYSAEHGVNPTLRTVVRLLRTYGRLGAIDDFIPAPMISPIDLIEGADRTRKRGG